MGNGTACGDLANLLAATTNAPRSVEGCDRSSSTRLHALQKQESDDEECRYDQNGDSLIPSQCKGELSKDQGANP